MKTKRVCLQCGKNFWRDKWISQKCCSIKCGLVYRGHTKTYVEKTCPQCKKVFKSEAWKYQIYCSHKCATNSQKTTNSKLKQPRKKIKGNRRLSGYRFVMEEKIGRELTPKEHVHHIDMDNQNNSPDNLYLYHSNKAHGDGHATINKLTKSLLQQKIIKFELGKYYLGEIDDAWIG